jgi:hypothetical protein
MKELNDINGASKHTRAIVERLLTEFPDHLIGAEFGVAYGGGIEYMGKTWGERGTVFGFDTFTGHPKEIAEVCEYTKADGGQKAHAAVCMDPFYNGAGYGREKFAYEYIRSELDRQGLGNVVLLKGLITSKLNLNIPRLHYAFLDLDFPLSMWDAYNLVKDKIVPGGYLCLHDVLPKGHIHGLWEYYQQMLEEGLFDIDLEDPGTFFVSLKRNEKTIRPTAAPRDEERPTVGRKRRPRIRPVGSDTAGLF